MPMIACRHAGPRSGIPLQWLRKIIWGLLDLFGGVLPRQKIIPAFFDLLGQHQGVVSAICVSGLRVVSSSASGYLIRCIPLSFLARSAVPSGGPAVSSGAFGCPIRRPSLRSSLPLRFACGPLPFMWPWAATGPGWDSRTRLRHPACRENLRTRHPAYYGPLCACDILFFVNPFAPVASTARSKSPSLIFSGIILMLQKIVWARFDLGTGEGYLYR